MHDDIIYLIQFYFVSVSIRIEVLFTSEKENANPVIVNSVSPNAIKIN